MWLYVSQTGSVCVRGVGGKNETPAPSKLSFGMPCGSAMVGCKRHVGNVKRCAKTHHKPVLSKLSILATVFRITKDQSRLPALALTSPLEKQESRSVVM